MPDDNIKPIPIGNIHQEDGAHELRHRRRWSLI